MILTKGLFNRGTNDSCSYCRKGFGPDYNPARKNQHIIFNVRTKNVTYSGPTHMKCVEELRSLQLSGVRNEAF